MKKSFTLKAFAFAAAATMAMSASATPSQFLRTNNMGVATLQNQNVAVEAREQLMTADGKTVATTHRAPAARAEANYGDWSAAADGVYTFAQMVNNPVELNYKWQRRNDNANEGNFQVKVLDFFRGFTGADGEDVTFTITKAADGKLIPSLDEAYPIHYEAAAGQGGEKYPVYMTTMSHWLEMLRAAGEEFTDGPITDEVIASRAQFNSFDPETGVITIWPVYFLMMNNQVSWYSYPSTEEIDGTNYAITEQYRMIAPEYKNYEFEYNNTLGYFSHEKDATVGTYNDIYYELNDNDLAGFIMVQGNKSTNAVKELQQELMAGLMAETTPDNIVKVTEKSGYVNLPLDKMRSGQYTLIYAFRNAKMAEDEFMISNKINIRLLADELAYYSVGEASFEDNVMLQALPPTWGAENWEELTEMLADESGINLPATLKWQVPVQTNGEGKYRLVHPYGKFYMDYLSQQLDYNPFLDYCVFYPADKDKVFTDICGTGIYFSTQSNGEIMMVYGSVNKFDPEAEGFGNNNGSAITFPANSLAWTQASYDSEEQVIGNLPEWAEQLEAPMVITGQFCANASASIENVAADAENLNAPVKYYNLQGIEVANPAAGQVVIKVQGTKASKELAR